MAMTVISCPVFHALMDSVFLSSDTLKPIEINKISKASSTKRVDGLLAKMASQGLYPPSHSTYLFTQANNEHSFGILSVCGVLDQDVLFLLPAALFEQLLREPFLR